MLGFMLPTCILSMFLNNLATVAMMMPILEQLLVEYEKGLNKDEETKLCEEKNTSTADINGNYNADRERSKDKGLRIRRNFRAVKV